VTAVSETSSEERAKRLRQIVDDILTNRDLHGLEPRVARDLQLAAAAINHDRFHRLLRELADLLSKAD
jgi:hypothetical protein